MAELKHDPDPKSRVSATRSEKIILKQQARVSPQKDRLDEISKSHPSLDRLFDRATAVRPILEAADIVDMVVAHVLEHLAGERRTSTGGAI